MTTNNKHTSIEFEVGNVCDELQGLDQYIRNRFHIRSNLLYEFMNELTHSTLISMTVEEVPLNEEIPPEQIPKPIFLFSKH